MVHFYKFLLHTYLDIENMKHLPEIVELVLVNVVSIVTLASAERQLLEREKYDFYEMQSLHLFRIHQFILNLLLLSIM